VILSLVAKAACARRRARRLLVFLAVLVTLACAQAESPDVAAPSPAPPAPTPHPICAAALAQSPTDAWPPPSASRAPAAVLAFVDVDATYLLGYAIDDQTGGLTRVARLDFGLYEYDYARLVAAPSGDLAYCLLGRGPVFAQSLRIGGDGQIAEIPGAHSYPSGGDPVFHPTRRLVYAGSTIYRASLDGTLASAPGKSPPSDALRIHPNGVFAYADGRQYCIDSEGVPQEVASYKQPGVAILESSGGYLIAANDLECRSYHIDPRTGLPTFVSATPRPLYRIIRALPHPTRSFFYILGERNRSLELEAYAVDVETGGLTLIETKPAVQIRFDGGVEIDPGGRFLYEWGTLRSWGGGLGVKVWRMEADGRLSVAASFTTAAVPLAVLFFEGPPSRP
jgi:hypothetical protein